MNVYTELAHALCRLVWPPNTVSAVTLQRELRRTLPRVQVLGGAGVFFVVRGAVSYDVTVGCAPWVQVRPLSAAGIRDFNAAPPAVHEELAQLCEERLRQFDIVFRVDFERSVHARSDPTHVPEYEP